MGQPLKVLLVEDRPEDAELVVTGLRRAGFDPSWRRVETEADYLEHLNEGLDLVLSDYVMPEFSGFRALELVKKLGLHVPFIIISGTIGEETAVAAMKEGAADYLLKDRLARLGPAVIHALEQSRMRRERHQAAEDLARVQARYRGIFENAIEGIYQATLEGRIIAANPALARITGYASPEALMEGITDIGKNLYADPKARDELQRQLLDRGVVKGFETQICRKDGELIWVSINARAVFDEQGALCQEGSLEDITERRRTEEQLRLSEERFRQLAENIHEVFWISDLIDNGVLYVSPAYEKVWGRSCESLYADPNSWLEAVHPDDRERVAQAVLNKKNSDKYDEIYRIARPDGALRWIRDRAFPIRDAAGKAYRFAGTAEDITERHQLEMQFRQAQKMEAIGTLAGGIAHDFNNILGAIIGYTEMARMCVKQVPEADEYLDAVLKGAQRAASLVRQILAFGRQREQQRTVVQLRHVVAEPLELLRATIPASIECRTSLAKDVPTVLADVTQIHQVVMNLCTNAVHAMKDRPGRLEVTLEEFTVDMHLAATNPHLHPGPYVRLSVSDTGCGMDAATLERIFEPFFTTKAPGEGTGLGLSVVHGIMRNHDGAVTVYSQPGEGTTFRLYFPVHGQEAEAEAPAERPAPPRGRGERILFVDDEMPLVHLGQVILEELGYTVTISTNPMEAIASIRADPTAFDLVITDLTMPYLSGTDLARLIFQQRPDLPVILVTGYTANLTAESVRALGIQEMLFKPLTVQILGAAVHRVFAKKGAASAGGPKKKK
jgi:PAS domain S-box-containing protein